MKQSLLLIAGSFFFHACFSQAVKSIISNEKVKLTSFEEKQTLQKETSNVLSSSAPVVSFRFAIKKAIPTVVYIKTASSAGTESDKPSAISNDSDDDVSPFYYEPGNKFTQSENDIASGVIVSNDGYIVTTNHVVDEADSIEVILGDKRSYKAKIIGADPATDLALLKIDENNLPFIEFGNSDSIEVGDVVLAIGNPFNLTYTVTLGIVSAKARNINVLKGKSSVESYIQTDAAINLGNSGGALLDINGKLIGINAAMVTPSGVYAGYSFAIPVEIVKKIVDDLLIYGKVMRGHFGIIISDMNGEKAKKLGTVATTGVIVDSLQTNGAALKAGIQRNDVIIKIDNHNIEALPQLHEIVARHRPKEKLQVTVIRNGKEKILAVTLQPKQEKAVAEANELLQILGIEIEDLSANERSKLKLPGGVKVVSITKGKIEKYTSIEEGFIITKVNNKAVNNADEFIKELRDKKGGVLLEGVYPGVQGVHYYAFGL